MVIAIRIVWALLATVAFQSVTKAQTPMTFFMETDPKDRWAARITRGGVEDIFAVGDITEGTTDRLLAFIRANKVEAAKVHFNSPGGSLVEGMRLGRAIRRLQFFTTVGAYTPTYDPEADTASICASACAYAFAGGTSRFLTEYSGRLGVHQFYTDGTDSLSGEAAQQVSGMIVAYLGEMGIDAKVFTISTIADRNGMIWLTPDDALKLRFANNGSDAPVAEIKLAGMTPYLKVQQEHHDVTTRVLFYCIDKTVHMEFGIVTNPETSAMIAGNQKRSYLELDYKEYLVVPGGTGAQASDSVVWIGRDLTSTNLAQLNPATEIGGWIDGFGAVRYGATLQMPMVREKIAEFGRQCYSS